MDNLTLTKNGRKTWGKKWAGWQYGCKGEKDFSESQHKCLHVLTLLLGWRHVSALLLGHLQVTRCIRRRNCTVKVIKYILKFNEILLSFNIQQYLYIFKMDIIWSVNCIIHGSYTNYALMYQGKNRRNFYRTYV